MNLRCKCLLSILLVLCFTMAVFAGKLPKPKTPEQKIEGIVKKTRDSLKAKTGGKGPCWESFTESLKTYADTRTGQVEGCGKNAERCVNDAVNGMGSDAKLAIGSFYKCTANCAKGGCSQN